MNNNIISKQLIKIAKQLISSNKKLNLVLDNNGNVLQISDTQFYKNFISKKIASISTKTVIYVSPCVNATNPPDKGIKGVFTRIQNVISTLFNKFYSKRKIFDVIMQNEDQTRGSNDTYHLGCTIQKGKGVYPSGLQNKIYIEDSYIITIYGATNEEANKIAQGLKTAFAQESVLIEYNGNIISDYLF